MHWWKLTSNSKAVLDHFPTSEVAAPAAAADSNPSSVQRALGVVWDTQTDNFSPSLLAQTRPFTKRGILATVNALGCNPAGLISPITLAGQLFRREIIPQKKSGSELVNYQWDDALPDIFRFRWETLVDSLRY